MDKYSSIKRRHDFVSKHERGSVEYPPDRGTCVPGEKEKRERPARDPFVKIAMSC